MTTESASKALTLIMYHDRTRKRESWIVLLDVFIEVLRTKFIFHLLKIGLKTCVKSLKKCFLGKFSIPIIINVNDDNILTSAVRYSRIAELYTAAVAPTRPWLVVLLLRWRWILPTGNWRPARADRDTAFCLLLPLSLPALPPAILSGIQICVSLASREWGGGVVYE